MQTTNLDTTTCVEPLKTAEQLINSIPTDADSVILIEHLNLVIQQLSSVSEMEATFFVQAKVTVRFGLTKSQTNSIVRSIRELRKKNQAGGAEIDQAQKPTEFVSDFPSLMDVVEEDGKSVFLVKLPDGSVSIEDRIELDDRTLLPPPTDSLPYLLPRAGCVMAELENYKTGAPKEIEERLYDNLLQYLGESADLPDPAHYHLLTAWVFHTYLMEYFHYSPILLLFGQPAIGKSRLGRALVHASFRGVQLESLSGAHLIRFAEDHHATLFVDVKNLGKKLSREQTLDLMLLRAERGAVVPRIIFAGKGAFLDTRFFRLFGPTVAASNEPFDDNAFESRTLCIRMPLSMRDFKHPVTPEEAMPLRERLTAFRAWHFGDALPAYTNLQIGRMGDITDPIFQMIEMVKPSEAGSVDQVIGKLREDAWACHQESPETRVLTAVKNLAEHSRTNRLEVYEIWQHVNGGREGLPVISREKIGRILTAAGFARTRSNSGRSAIEYTTSSLSALLSRHGMVFMPVVLSDSAKDAR